jgi:hypothetical protein
MRITLVKFKGNQKSLMSYKSSNKPQFKKHCCFRACLDKGEENPQENFHELGRYSVTGEMLYK